MKKEIPTFIQVALDRAAKSYSESPSTTNAGRMLRFIVRCIPTETIIKMFAQKLG